MLKSEDIKKLCESAKIMMQENELENFADDLNDMLAFINTVNEKDFDVEFNGFDDEIENIAEDEIGKSLTYEEIFKDVDNRDNFYVVKEREM